MRELLCEKGGIIVSKEENFDFKKVFFIIDTFEENELFFQLQDKGCSIVSTNCIYSSIKDNKPLPEHIKYPLFARFMEGMTICIPASGDYEEQLRSLVRYMGGTDEEAITDTVDILVVDKVGSIQYQVAQTRNIPIVSSKWIASCWEEQTLLPHNFFLLPPFAGCVISVTGLSTATRSEIQRLTEYYGGEYTPNLTKRCTHLISHSAQGIKYRYATEWGLHCVSVEWFFDSINMKVCADETRYFLPMTNARRQALLNPLSISPRDLSRLSPALRKKHLMQLYNRNLPRGFSINVPIPNQPVPLLTPKKLSVLPKLSRPIPVVQPQPEFKIYSDKKPKANCDLEENSELDSEQIASKLQQLLDQCNETIEHYTKLAQEVDLSPYINTAHQQLNLLK
uniref:BRCT domain-containing protein n=1 Tax=Arcella intermedia TaxID=1963864 RepID=A0A6B2L5Y0_9EUKA